jgi:hypothetical protein
MRALFANTARCTVSVLLPLPPFCDISAIVRIAVVSPTSDIQRAYHDKRLASSGLGGGTGENVWRKAERLGAVSSSTPAYLLAAA